MSVELWTEKYRPTTLDDYVWRDPAQRAKAEEWIRDGALPHLIFSGVSGTGKTSLAYLLLKMLDIPRGDILFIPASRVRKVEEIAEKIVNFASTWALGPTGIKYIILDEVDAISILSQRLLRNEMEQNSNVCRFILTCNYPQKIAPEIHGRCQGFQFKALDEEQFVVRLINILTNEGVSFTDETLGAVVSKTYPDLRKAINLAQEKVIAGILTMVGTDDGIEVQDYVLEMAAMFQAGRTLEARKLVVSKAQPEEYVDIFRYFYRHLELWGETEEQKDEALICIRRGLVNHAIVGDPEINLAATLVELSRIVKQ